MVHRMEVSIGQLRATTNCLCKRAYLIVGVVAVFDPFGIVTSVGSGSNAAQIPPGKHTFTSLT